ncbi:MAG: glycosyltransferase family 39 protein [Actinomycetota bacterium]|nr:glycosyltransferase family 39 protein [Actinomycetota bacterium]
MRALLRRPTGPELIAYGLLLAILAVGLYLRLRHNGYGLPYVYNYDEAQHFTNKAVTMVSGDLDPGYYQNPSAFTYLVLIAMKLVYGVLGVELTEGSIRRQFIHDPTPIWELARGLSAVLALAGVVATFWVGKRIWGARVAVAAAAILCFSFLPVVYSRIALTDTGTFLPVVLCVYFSLRAWEDGRTRHYVLAGVAAGFAVGFKYTAGLVLAPLFVAGAIRFWRDRETPLLRRSDLRGLVLAGVATTVAFAITTPYFFVKPISALYQLKQQAEAAGESAKLGQSQEGGFSYYVKSLTWGFGWAAIVAALAGAVLEIRRDRWRGLLLVLFPIVLFLYMGSQTRYFGRWLLPMYPVLALLAAVALVRLAGLIRSRPVVQGLALAALVAGVLAQSVVADIRTSEVLGKKDTRQMAREFLELNYDEDLRIVIEPAVPDNFYRVVGSRTRQRQFVRGFVRDVRRRTVLDAPEGADTTYAATLTPDLIDLYRAQGFCMVMTMSVIRGRAENAKVPQALAYYDRLEREAERIWYASPYDPGADKVSLHYDFSYNYYPRAYSRPGPEVGIYRLKDCKQGYKRIPPGPAGTKGLDKGVATSYRPKS